MAGACWKENYDKIKCVETGTPMEHRMQHNVAKRGNIHRFYGQSYVEIKGIPRENESAKTIKINKPLSQPGVEWNC